MSFIRGLAVPVLSLLWLQPMAAFGQESGYLSAVALIVSDLDRSTAYYGEVFGFENARTIKTETLRENILRLPGERGAALVLVQPSAPQANTDRSARLVFRVPDPAAVVEKARGAGSEVVREAAPLAAVGGQMGMVRDPDGYTIELLQMPAPSGTE